MGFSLAKSFHDGPRRFEQGFASRGAKRLWRRLRRRFSTIADQPAPEAMRALRDKYAK